jgi:hypothetical protein
MKTKVHLFHVLALAMPFVPARSLGLAPQAPRPLPAREARQRILECGRAFLGRRGRPALQLLAISAGAGRSGK